MSSHATAPSGELERLFSDPIPLERPIRRGEQTIESVKIRKPNSGELRGANLLDLGQMNVDALMKVLPRVTQPPLFQTECDGLDPADLMSMAVEVSAFLLGKRARPDSPAA